MEDIAKTSEEQNLQKLSDNLRNNQKMKDLLKELYAKKDCTALADVLEIAFYGHMDADARKNLISDLVARGIIKD